VLAVCARWRFARADGLRALAVCVCRRFVARWRFVRWKTQTISESKTEATMVTTGLVVLPPSTRP
jgi:hypothetical protein